MTDVAPALLEAIEEAFKEKYNANKLIDELLKKTNLTYKEANEYAIQVGEALAGAYQNVLSGEVLPDGKMYWNIAERVIKPTMKNNYNLITDYSATVQHDLNQQAKVGIIPQKPELNEDRIKGILERVSGADEFDKIKWILEEPIVNFSQSIVDDYIQENVKFQAKVGFKPKIVRKSTGKCCDWCNEVAGTYTYPDAPKDVYRRHRFCQCTVEYDPGTGKVQNVHTKKWQDPEEDAKIEERIERIKNLKKDEFNNATPAKFSEAVKEAKNHVDEQDRWRVSAYDPDHYMGAKLHVTSNGSTTAVDKEGDIISVCRRSGDSVRGSDLISESVKNGGVKLDSYSGNHEFYLKNGFEPISWCEWVDEYAPDDWNPSFEKEPIIFYRYTGKQYNIESANEFLQRTLPSKDYAAAQAVRDKLLGD